MKLLIPFALAAIFALPEDKDCIRDGETATITFEVDPNDEPPRDRILIDGTIRGVDEDPAPFDDDPLGKGHGSQDERTDIIHLRLEIGNKNGWLSGPNGVTHNNGVEGPCLEVYMTYRATYYINVYVFGGPSYQEQVAGKFRTETREICPC